ncbi:MAG: phosphoribosyl-AMP cyclohydrolase [Coriobacteriales bacterium]|nr:phosphoribosyl-AMP cyclohydrolase [Coriobacteriales bacterium]
MPEPVEIVTLPDDVRQDESGETLAAYLNIKFDAQGLVPAIVQQFDSGEVLMMAWMNAQSLALTLKTGTTWFWSRSRQELWNKGATSGNIQQVKSIRYDCDADTLLILADSPGPACHTGHRSCFYRAVQ